MILFHKENRSIVKMLKIKEKQKILEAAKSKIIITFKGKNNENDDKLLNASWKTME